MKLAMLGAAHVHASEYVQVCKTIPDVEFTQIYDANLGTAKRIAELCDATATDDPLTCLSPAIDAVVICSENYRHVELVQSAALAGKDILCEKPLATNVADAQELVTLCSRLGVQLQTAFPCRYHPTIARTKELIDQGLLGEILAVRATNQGQIPGGWFADPLLAGGGALMDHTVHVVDLLRFLLHDEFDSVFAYSATRFHDVKTEDSAFLSMTLKNGVIVTLDPSWSRPLSYPTWGNVTMELVGTEGTLFVDMFSQNMEFYSTSSYQWLPFGTNMNRLMLIDFVERLQQKQPVAITGEDGLRATEVVAAAYLSVKTGTLCSITHV